MRPGDWVRVSEPLIGFAQRPSGTMAIVRRWRFPPARCARCSQLKRTTGWVTVHYDLGDSGRHKPGRVEAIVEPELLTATKRPELPPMIPEGTREHP